MQVHVFTFCADKTVKPPVKGLQGMYAHNIYIDTAGTSFHIFQAQDYVVAGRTESHQSVCVVAMN